MLLEVWEARTRVILGNFLLEKHECFKYLGYVVDACKASGHFGYGSTGRPFAMPLHTRASWPNLMDLGMGAELELQACDSDAPAPSV